MERHLDVQTEIKKIRTLLQFKTEFGTENYVQGFMLRGSRSLVAQFRAGVLPLAIECGRWRGIPCEERVCELCGDKVEDEIHFYALVQYMII